MDNSLRDAFPFEKGILELHQDFPLNDARSTGGLERGLRFPILHLSLFLSFQLLKGAAGVTLDLRLLPSDGFGRIFGTTPEPQTAEHQPGQNNGGSRWTKNPLSCAANESDHSSVCHHLCLTWLGLCN